MKAQISGQVFVFIFAIIVAAAILVFGYKGVAVVLENAEKAKVASFVNQLEGHAAEARSYGTLKQNIQYNLPARYKYLCFSDESTAIADVPSDKALIKTVITNKEQKNVFLGPELESYFIKDLAVYPVSVAGDCYSNPSNPSNLCCFSIDNGVSTVAMFGCGKVTKITQQPSTGLDSLNFRTACA